MTSIDTILARSISLRTIPILVVACFAIPVAPAQQQDATGTDESKATVVAALESEVAARVDGLLVNINFTAGQLVKKGDLLFEFGTRRQELRLALAQATLKQAGAQLRLAEVKLSNAQTLRARNVASEMEARAAEAQRDVAAAKVEEGRASMQLAEFQLSEMTLYAPMSGIISRPFIREGAYITKEAREHSRLATIVQLDPIHVVGKTPAAMYFQRAGAFKSIEQVAEQREFKLLLPTGDNYPYTGRPVARSYAFNTATQTIEVTVEFPNPHFLLRPGLDVILISSTRAK